MPLQANAQPEQVGAEPPHAAVSWQAPAGCPGERAVVHQVEDFLGQPLAEATAHPVQIRGRVSRDDAAGYRLMLQMESVQGMRGRTLQHDDCTKLAEAAALLMAMAIDPERVKVAEPTEPPRDEAPAPAEPAMSQPPGPAAPSASRQAPRQQATETIQSVSLGLTGLVGAGVLPGTGLGIGAELGATAWESVRLIAAAHYWPERSLQLIEPDGASARLEMVSAGLRGCWISLGRWEAGACVGPEVGRISGSGHGLDSEQQAGDRWSALLVDLRLGYAPARWVRLTLSGEAAAALERPRFTVDLPGGPAEVHRPEPWGLRGRVGVALVLPTE